MFKDRSDLFRSWFGCERLQLRFARAAYAVGIGVVLLDLPAESGDQIVEFVLPFHCASVRSRREMV